jgi:recombination associated protein RdgC
MFRNVFFMRVAGSWPESEDELDEALSAARFTPCGPLSEKSSGWEPPVDDAHGRLCRRVGGADLLQLRTQSRLLPAAAVNEAVEARLEEYRQRMGDLPGRREARRLKLDTRDKLLPKALLRSERTRGLYLGAERVLAIDAGSSSRVERFVDTLQLALGGLALTELSFRQPVEGLLRRMFLGETPPGLDVGRECRMQDSADPGASIRFVDMDLADATIRRHVRDGMALTHLGIEFEGHMSCVLDDKGRIGKLKIAGMDAEDAGAAEDPLARFDAELVLLAETLRRFLGALTKLLGKAG